MKFSARQYAAALLEAASGKPEAERKRLLKRFFLLLVKNGDFARLGAVLQETERQFLKASGTRKVKVETPAPLAESVKKDIEHLVGKKVFLEETINPALLAGIRILIDEEILIDASAETQIRKMFSSS